MDEAAPAYRFTVRFLARWAFAAVFGRRRSLAEDTRDLYRRYPTPVFEATEHMPLDGPAIVMMNHYERPGFRAWWAAALVTWAVWCHRGEEPTVRWLVADRFYGFRAGPLRIPVRLVRMVLRRVATVYSLIAVPRPREHSGVRAGALRRTRNALRAGQVVGITPEADAGFGKALEPPGPGAGLTIAILSRGTVPVVPVVVYEREGRVVARFGPPFLLDRGPGPDELTGRCMRALAELLPRELRGPYDGGEERDLA